MKSHADPPFWWDQFNPDFLDQVIQILQKSSKKNPN